MLLETPVAPLTRNRGCSLTTSCHQCRSSTSQGWIGEQRLRGGRIRPRHTSCGLNSKLASHPVSVPVPESFSADLPKSNRQDLLLFLFFRFMYLFTCFDSDLSLAPSVPSVCPRQAGSTWDKCLLSRSQLRTGQGHGRCPGPSVCTR